MEEASAWFTFFFFFSPLCLSPPEFSFFFYRFPGSALMESQALPTTWSFSFLSPYSGPFFGLPPHLDISFFLCFPCAFGGVGWPFASLRFFFDSFFFSRESSPYLRYPPPGFHAPPWYEPRNQQSFFSSSPLARLGKDLSPASITFCGVPVSPLYPAF